MKAIRFVVLSGMLAAPVWAQSLAQSAPAVQTPAQQKIAWANKAIEKNPQRAEPYNQLAMALARRARETSDPKFYADAESALQKSLAIEPKNREARKISAWLRLGKHEFAAALAEAQALNREAPDDVTVYGMIVDAQVHLGNCAEAEKAAQWMLDLRPGNVPGLTRAAHLRELFGDVPGALELMEMAFQQTPLSEAEDRAWLLTQMAHLHLSTGKVETAEAILNSALQLFPDYHYALAGMAEARTAQGKHEETVKLLRRRYEGAPHAENLFDLAEALHRAGMTEEANKAFAQFETLALAEAEKLDNANRELIFYYADYAKKPAEALRIATAEVARRRDVQTLDAYAWALHSSGKHTEALKQIQSALAVGIRDARILHHAGVIAQAQGDREAALRYLRESLSANPRSRVAADAQQSLRALEKTE